MLHVAGHIDAGDLVLIPLRKGQNVLLRLTFGDGQSGVDEHPVGGGDLIQHDLELFNVGKGLAAGKDEIAFGGDGIHPADALDNLLQREAGHVPVFFLIDTEGAVVFAVVGDKDGDGSAAFPCFVWMIHDDRSAFPIYRW